MGQRTDAEKRAELLETMSRHAYDLIRTIELERSGIRGGHGSWGGSDELGRYALGIDLAYSAYRAAWRTRDTGECNEKAGVPVEAADVDDCIPF